MNSATMTSTFARLTCCAVTLSLAACSSSKKDSTDQEMAPAADWSPNEANTPPAADSCITDVTPGHQKLSCEGLEFELTVPDVCTTKKCGFITDVHGFAMNA